jgi:hypothetical protein
MIKATIQARRWFDTEEGSRSRREKVICGCDVAEALVVVNGGAKRGQMAA